MNLYEKIVAIMADVEYLKKDDVVGTGKSSYKAITEEKVTNTVRQSLIKHKVVILPIKQERRESFMEYEKENTYAKTIEKKQRLMTEVNTTYKIINAEKPEESIEVVSSGSGVDTQDKGIGKAMTYAYKYMMLRCFAIPTGEDPDKIHNDELEEKGTVKKEQQAKPTKPQSETPQVDELEAKLKIAINAIYKLAKEKKIETKQLYKIAEEVCGDSFIKGFGEDKLSTLYHHIEKL